MFPNDWKFWKRHPKAYKTWEYFKRDFNLSHRELCESKVTSAGSGYHYTNAIYQKYMVNTINNLANATVNDRQTVYTISVINSILTLKLTAVKKILLLPCLMLPN